MDLETSRRLGRLVRARNGNCYLNAFRAHPHVPGALYVEGVVHIENHPLVVLEHGWLEQPDGAVLDPTPTYCRPGERSAVTYFPAFRWTFEELHALLDDLHARGEVFMPLHSMLPDDHRADVSHRNALIAAWRHATALHERRLGAA